MNSASSGELSNSVMYFFWRKVFGKQSRINGGSWGELNSKAINFAGQGENVNVNATAICIPKNFMLIFELSLCRVQGE